MQMQSSAIQSSLYYHAVTFWTIRSECVAEVSNRALTKPPLVCIGKEQTKMVAPCKRSKNRIKLPLLSVCAVFSWTYICPWYFRVPYFKHYIY